MGVNDPQYAEEELEQMRRENEEGVTFEGRHYTTYEATQRQRKYERAIREQKRKIMIDEAMEENGKDIQRTKRPGFENKPGPFIGLITGSPAETSSGCSDPSAAARRR